MYEFLLILMGYLYGSIPFALVIGMLFYHTDIRKSGSGNLGGTNAGRVLGKKVGLSVIILDASKAVVIVLLTQYLCKVLQLNENIAYVAGLACIIGHCYPIFAGFKGGKAVSTCIGYFLCVHPIGALIALIIFLAVLKCSKYVSLSSITAALSVLLATPFLPLTLTCKLCILVAVALLVYRHRENIVRIKNHTESKISWM